MKRAIVPIVVLFLMCGIVVGLSRFLLPGALAAQTVAGKTFAEQIAGGSKTVSYKGVIFSLNLSLAPDVKSETIPASTEGKPSDIWPEHPGFTLLGSYRIRSQRDNDPQIRIFQLAKFREAVAIASDRDAKNVIYPPNPPAWTIYFDEEVRVLKELLRAKPAPANVGRFLAKARGEKGCTAAMPFLPMWEACQAFAARVRYINFRNGTGVFFLTQWDVGETSQIANDGLEYAFQGITNDSRHWVYAEFSVRAPFLPNGDEPDVIAWNEKNYLLSHKSKQYQAYVRPVLAKLEALPANKFQPNLELLEQLIQSLEVKEK
ncbi:MAG TPA: hypothetical protein VIF81_11390 [Pyrinomonadaceae bacterium]|jgi:hypothetical protein